MTRTHTTLRQGGRLRFVAPELSAGPARFRINEESDVYSLAMTIYALGTGLAPLHDIGSDFAASREAEKGKRPSKFHSSVSSPSPSASELDAREDAMALLCLGGLTEVESELVWLLLIQMWDQDPSSRPSMSHVRKAMALNGLIPLSSSPPLEADSTPPLSPTISFATRSDTASSSSFSYSPLSSAPTLVESPTEPGQDNGPQVSRAVRHSKFIPSWAVAPHVLVVEDDLVSRSLVSKFLQVSGCEITVAGDGLGAVSKMELETYDLVLMVSD